MNNSDVTQSIDASGLRCPMPLLKTKKALSSLQCNQVLKVIATDVGAKRDIPSFVALTPHELLGVEETSDGYIFFIRKGE